MEGGTVHVGPPKGLGSKPEGRCYACRSGAVLSEFPFDSVWHQVYPWEPPRVQLCGYCALAFIEDGHFKPRDRGDELAILCRAANELVATVRACLARTP